MRLLATYASVRPFLLLVGSIFAWMPVFALPSGADDAGSLPLRVFERGCLAQIPHFKQSNAIFRAEGLQEIGDGLFKSGDPLILASVREGDYKSLGCTVRAPKSEIGGLASALSSTVGRTIGVKDWNIRTDDGQEPIWGYFEEGYGIVILLVSEPTLGPILNVTATPPEGTR